MAALSIVHLLNFDMSLKGREIFSRDNTHGKLLATDHGTFGTTDFMSKYNAYLLGGSLAASVIEPGTSGPKLDAIATRLPTAVIKL